MFNVYKIIFHLPELIGNTSRLCSFYNAVQILRKLNSVVVLKRAANFSDFSIYSLRG